MSPTLLLPIQMFSPIVWTHTGRQWSVVFVQKRSLKKGRDRQVVVSQRALQLSPQRSGADRRQQYRRAKHYRHQWCTSRHTAQWETPQTLRRSCGLHVRIYKLILPACGPAPTSFAKGGASRTLRGFYSDAPIATPNAHSNARGRKIEKEKNLARAPRGSPTRAPATWKAATQAAPPIVILPRSAELD